MGRKGSWFSAVRKALSPEPKEKKEKKTSKSKKQWFGKQKSSDSEIIPVEAVATIPAPHSPLVGEVKLSEAENEQSKHAYSVAFATAVAAEAAVAAAQAAAEVVRLTTAARYSGRSLEEIAAIKIQTVFRGYLARRALRALRGLVRLKKLIQGQSVRRQATTTLRCMQTLARVQSQVRARRIRMSEENQALQRQLLQKHETELNSLRASIGDSWDDSTYSKEKVEASLQNKQEAAIRRERALAYSYSHQQMWKNSSKSANPTFMDPNNPHWGWSWLERWMAARPWETSTTTEDHSSLKSSTRGGVGEISRSYSGRNLNQENKISPAGQKTNRRQSFSPTPSKTPIVAGRSKPPSPKGSVLGTDEDSRSIFSVQSERYQYRRHSIAGSSVRDDESLASSPAVPSYMSSTKSASARSRLTSPLGSEKKGSSEKGSTTVGSAKKRLSFTGSSPAGRRRHSGPPRVDTSTVTSDIRVN